MNTYSNSTFSELREYLANEVLDRGRFASGDAKTFLWAKTQQDFWDDVPILEMGGGNFTTTLSCLAALSFLGTIYALLESDKPRIITKEESAFMRALKKKHKNYGQFIIVPKEGEWIIPNERDMIWQLLNNACANLGISKSEFDPVWRAYRHKLVHTFGPAVFFPIKSEGDGISGHDPKKIMSVLMQIDQPVFENHADGQGKVLTSECLLRDVIKATAWLVSHIKSYQEKDQPRIERATDWIAKQKVDLNSK